MTKKKTTKEQAGGKTLYDNMPGNFSLCIQAECPLAAHCLRRMMWDEVPQTRPHITIVNPAQTLFSEQCPHYRPDTPVVYARGFTNMQAQMFPAQYERFCNKLIAHFSRNPYYERRRGERLCSPSEIAYIRQVLQQMGLSSLEFDAYEEHYNWKD